MHKADDLGHIQQLVQLKLQLKNELEEKLKEKFKDRETETASSDSDDDSHSSPAVVPPSPPETKPRAASKPPLVLGISPFHLTESPEFRKRKASLSEKIDESRPEVETVIKPE